MAWYFSVAHVTLSDPKALLPFTWFLIGIMKTLGARQGREISRYITDTCLGITSDSSTSPIEQEEEMVRFLICYWQILTLTPPSAEGFFVSDKSENLRAYVILSLPQCKFILDS